MKKWYTYILDCDHINDRAKRGVYYQIIKLKKRVKNLECTNSLDQAKESLLHAMAVQIARRNYLLRKRKAK